ncbi:MAG TPA: SdrD B-like domain-containing protein, partial [Anaerolineae bacterium]|nr:SdrD B-like domain-containing protein [Anaerolineae bacterium]
MSTVLNRKVRSRVLYLSMILALVLSIVPQALPGVETPTAEAHNLQTKMVYMFPDPDTQAFLDARIAGTLSEVPPYAGPPNPLLRVGDELGIIIKVVPRDGTTTGVGGHVDFYVPNGVQVIDAAYLLPGDADPLDGITGYDKVPMKGQSLIATGAGPIGAKATAQLAGLTGTYTNILGVTEDPVTAAGLHRGTIAGVYGDTGIFYSTDPDTAYGSWQRFTGDPDEVCGLAGLPGVTGKTITNNSGDVFVPCNKWDAGQMFAWGTKGTTYPGGTTSPAGTSAPIVDYGDGRGNAPWGFASGVAGPQSGYAWAFDWEGWRLSPRSPADMRAAMADTKIGPWQRIQYPGSRVSLDQPGSASSALGMASTDASTLGVAANTLPATTDQTTSGGGPKAIRWAVGQLTNLIPEYVWVKIRVDDTAAIVNEDGCPVFNADTFGGDAGGSDNGKDHLWRYYEPSRVTWNGCVGIGKPSDLAAVSVGQTFQYNVDFYNLGTTTLTNVVVRDTLPSGVAFISAFPAQNSGPNPLVWNLGTLQPGQKFSSLITVRATGTGVLTNRICVTSNELDEQCSQEDIPSGNFPLLKQNKSVSPLAVAPGGTVQYTVRIDNIGSGTTGSPVKIEEHLEAGFSYVGPLVSVTINGANVTASTTVNAADPQNPIFTLSSAAGGIQAGQSLFLTFTAAIAPATDPGSYCNWFTSYTPSVPATTGSLACVTVAGGRIGDTIWRDWNGDGVQDAGEEGIAGVTVKLYAADGTTLLYTTTTDANGNYFFPGLVA